MGWWVGVCVCGWVGGLRLCVVVYVLSVWWASGWCGEWSGVSILNCTNGRLFYAKHNPPGGEFDWGDTCVN